MTRGLRRRTLDALEIEDERSFRHVALYGDLKEVLRKDGYVFRTLDAETPGSWDRALFLNLTFWGADEGGDVLEGDVIPADVVAHVAWHRLAHRALRTPDGAKPSASALFLGEAIASAFDLYLVGRLLGHAPNASFLATQVPAMAETAQNAGVEDDAFDAMLQTVAEDPEAAFGSLRELLYDVTGALHACGDAEAALAVLDRFASHRFGALLHRYELANWVLYARAYGSAAPSPDADAIDRALREAPDPLAWLVEHWVRPALAP